MGSDTTLFHGTDSTAYRVSERIRFGHNRFFLRLLAQARCGRAFNLSDRVLDVGCGDGPYFTQLWNNVVPEFGRPQFVHGIDSENIKGQEVVSDSRDYRLQQIDFFDFNSEEQWDVVYSSFCHAWLRAPRSGEETEAGRDDLIGSKLQTLIKPGGWFAGHYPGERDYFPYYNRLVVAALKRIGNPLGDGERYFEFRDCQLQVPPSLDSIRASFRKYEFATRVLLKTIEWIPVRRETEFLAYWESGGKKLLEGKLGAEQYGRFRKILSDLIADVGSLAALGVRTFSNNHEFVLLPTFHIYHVAQRQPATDSSRMASPSINHSYSIAMPLKAISEFQANAEDSDKAVNAVADVVDAFLKRGRARTVYLAVIEAGGKQRLVEHKWYAGEFKSREQTVIEGRKLHLPTFTNAIFSPRLGRTGRTEIAALVHVTDRSSGALCRLMGESESANKIQELWIEMTFLWPEGVLRSLFDKNDHPLAQSDELLGRLHECSDWPRLIVESDSAFSVAQELDLNELNSDLSGPLRYFLWQSRVGGPSPFCFLVFPQRLERLGVEGSQTCFLMWQEADRPAPHVTEAECALLLAMQPLAMMEIAEEAGKQGQGDVWDDFSHETKQVAQAMRAFWSLPLNKQETDALLPIVRKRFPNLPDKLRLLPFPDVLESASFLIELWATARSPLFLFEGEEPKSIQEIAQVAWKLARNSIKAALPLHDEPNEVFANAPRWLLKIDETWAFEKCVAVREVSMPLGKVLRNLDWLSDVTKLLIALFRNIIQHAHPDKPIAVLLDASSDSFVISISSYKDNVATNSLQGEFEAINDARIKRGQQQQKPIGRGVEVIQRLVGGEVLRGHADNWEVYDTQPEHFTFAITMPLTPIPV